jgi:nucleoid DNA-binding protein
MSGDNKITLHSFTALVGRRGKVSREEADSYIHQLAITMSGELETGGDIHLYRFGRFHTTHADEQPGHDPNTGEALTIPEHSRVHFRPYSALRLAVNVPFRQLRIRELSQDKTTWRIRTVAWILLALIAVLLIAIGITSKSLIFPQDVSVVSTGMSSENTAAAPTDQAPDTGAPADDTAAGVPAEPEPPPVPVSVAEAPIEPEPTVMAKAEVMEVLVVPGDTLWDIAATRWGDSGWWPVIYGENRSDLSRRNPDHIESGMTLWIPVLAGRVSSPDAADLRRKTNAYQVVADDYGKLDNPRAPEYETAAARGFKE